MGLARLKYLEVKSYLLEVILGSSVPNHHHITQGTIQRQKDQVLHQLFNSSGKWIFRM